MEKNIVEKSRALLEMKNSGYSVGEYKILDTYLSRINPRDVNTRFVKFSKKEYMSLMNIDSKVRDEQLKKYTAHFLGNVVTMARPDGKKGYIQRNLFSLAEYDAEDEIITLACNEDPLVFNNFFNIEAIGYVRYRLSNIINLKSAYAIKLYLYLKDNSFRGTFEVKFENLRERLECTSKYYESYKNFNKDILKRIVEDINSNTDINVQYDKIQVKRVTSGIKFNVQDKRKIAFQNYSDVETELLKTLEIKNDKEFRTINYVIDEYVNLSGVDKEFYIKQKIIEIKTSTGVKNRKAYFVGIIKKNIEALGKEKNKRKEEIPESFGKKGVPADPERVKALKERLAEDAIKAEEIKYDMTEDEVETLLNDFKNPVK